MQRKIEFQRRHFEFLARIIGNMPGLQEYLSYDMFAYFAFALKCTNPQFNVDKFIRACQNVKDPHGL